MRFYTITITPTAKSKQFAPLTYSTLNADGSNNGSALRVDIDAYSTLFHQPASTASVIIHGVDFKDLNQSANWNMAQITVSVGMSKGLPLANPAQAGQILNGTIFQSFGNWAGNEVSLCLLIIPSTINPDETANLSFNWIKGTTLESAVRTTLKTAYPNLQVFGGFSPNLVYSETQAGQYSDMKTFAQVMNSLSKQIITAPDYTGACISSVSGGFNLGDSLQPKKKSVTINFTDLIGNLTWIDISTIQAKMVMRADLDILNFISFPKGSPTTNTATGFGQLRNLTSFDGQFQIVSIHHVGSSRQPDAAAWVTIVNGIIPNVPLAQQ